ncbi:P-loop containing nucleoside triphosphate hydrolase protein, partial [Trametes cingulata]
MHALISTSHSFKFCSSEGRSLCRQILASHLPYSPHDYQLEGVCASLDGSDLLAITPTGSGKTSFLSMYILVLLYFSENPSRHPFLPPARVQQRPCLLVISPTKALEHDVEKKFRLLDIDTVVVNADTVDHARRHGQDIWKAAALAASVIILGPEQLKSPGFRGLLDTKGFLSRVVGLGVDEIHLLNSWGLEFRPVFRQIGDWRPRLHEDAILIGTTATLRPGLPTNTVTEFLRFRTSKTHVIRLSNARYDIQHCWLLMQSGSRACAFPELDWVLTSQRNVLIFCPTIALGTRILISLWHKAHSR